jgi:hypothetical protein
MAVTSGRPFALMTSAARTATNNSGDKTNNFARGVRVTIDCTVDPAAASVVFTIQGKTQQGDYYTLLASAAITAVGNTELTVHPQITAAANTVAKNALGNVWRLLATHADADSITYSAYAEYLN